MKKILLFLLSLTLIVTPACRREHTRASLITAGSVTAAAGVASPLIAATTITTISGIATIATIASVALPIGIIAGIAMITTGALIKKKKVKTTQEQEALVWNESDTPREKDIVRPAQSEPVVKPEQKTGKKFSRFPKNRLENA